MAVPAADQKKAIKDAIFASLRLARPGPTPKRGTLLLNTRDAVLAHALALGAVAMLMRCIDDDTKPSATDAIKLAELALRLARPQAPATSAAPPLTTDTDPFAAAADKAYGQTATQEAAQ